MSIQRLGSQLLKIPTLFGESCSTFLRKNEFNSDLFPCSPFAVNLLQEHGLISPLNKYKNLSKYTHNDNMKASIHNR